MAACRLVYDSRHLQADCQEPGPAPEFYAWQSSMGYFYLFSGNSFIVQLVIQACCENTGPTGVDKGGLGAQPPIAEQKRIFFLLK